MSTTFIYALCDPIRNEVKYVGKTNRIDRRMREHLRLAGLAPRTRKNGWLKGLLAAGARPEVEIIEEVRADEWEEAEEFWISYFKYIGADLTNDAPGGEGGGCIGEARKKQAASMRGRRVSRSADHLAKIVSANKARAKSKDWIAKITAAAKRRAEGTRAELMERLKLAWKAPRNKRYEVACRSCGELFVATNTRKMNCSQGCRLKHWKRRMRCLQRVK